MVLNESGSLQQSTWNDRHQRWIEFWFSPRDQCYYYGNCGPNSNCNPYNMTQFDCTCLPGFEPNSPGNWYIREGYAGCVRKLRASACRSGDGFVKVASVKVPDTSKAHANMSLSLKECEEECLGDCSCTAYASANESLGAHYRKRKSLSRKATVAIVLVSILSALLLAGSFSYRLVIGKRKDRRSHNPLNDIMNSTYFDGSRSVKDWDNRPGGNRDVPLFDLSIVASATNNFSILSKLGQGGFGSVYKGIMDNGTEIAVKRLSKHSGQGVEEFKNEVRLIAKLQHRNLVRILGCCVEEDEKMLIYEYLPNKSLDAFLFDTTKRLMLDWRKRFNIASTVARGLLYLHQDLRLRIIHRDLKASNVLLDAMNPKISDFSMARICGKDQTQGNANRVVGTFGYMSPEYAMGGIFSTKSDIYSFGVLLLEIISGKRNSAYYHENPSSSLVGHVWELWKEGNCAGIVDKSMSDSCSEEEALRCIQIGLLCVQESADDGLNMSTVVFMLANNDVRENQVLESALGLGLFSLKRMIEHRCDSDDELSSVEALNASHASSMSNSYYGSCSSFSRPSFDAALLNHRHGLGPASAAEALAIKPHRFSSNSLCR
ncbi:G-type lectin S-receptor-like serine/threonine-protein kinase RKS1 [Rhodamnia argentea]|uniref:G-type lectin S-receptor-like serine/threonine-protein kinase RKS1 n=1 Tax=Rhodamnia argentea TaxID=178133 RepID=A0ABM3HVZ8_9MYRT|nr:G-type lectin S-receptor-like serine/threonine-protein kinase RKS1 [Rhodamnia argentea]